MRVPSRFRIFLTAIGALLCASSTNLIAQDARSIGELVNWIEAEAANNLVAFNEIANFEAITEGGAGRSAKSYLVGRNGRDSFFVRKDGLCSPDSSIEEYFRDEVARGYTSITGRLVLGDTGQAEFTRSGWLVEEMDFTGPEAPDQAIFPLEQMAETLVTIGSHGVRIKAGEFPHSIDEVARLHRSDVDELMYFKVMDSLIPSETVWAAVSTRGDSAGSYTLWVTGAENGHYETGLLRSQNGSPKSVRYLDGLWQAWQFERGYQLLHTAKIESAAQLRTWFAIGGPVKWVTRAGRVSFVTSEEQFHLPGSHYPDAIVLAAKTDSILQRALGAGLILLFVWFVFRRTRFTPSQLDTKIQ